MLRLKFSISSVLFFQNQESSDLNNKVSPLAIKATSDYISEISMLEPAFEGLPFPVLFDYFQDYVDHHARLKKSLHFTYL